MPEEIVAEARQVDALASQGQPIPDTERAIGVTEVTHDHWRQQYGGWKNDQVRMLKDLEAENARLRRALTFMHKATNHDRVITYLKMRLVLALHSYSSNLVTGRQLRAARVLAGLTQRSLGAALGVDERQIRFWERRHHSRPSGARHHAQIERTLLDHGVILFAEPTPGARLVGDA